VGLIVPLVVLVQTAVAVEVVLLLVVHQVLEDLL
jgi:hypothetical protein